MMDRLYHFDAFFPWGIRNFFVENGGLEIKKESRYLSNVL